MLSDGTFFNENKMTTAHILSVLTNQEQILQGLNVDIQNGVQYTCILNMKQYSYDLIHKSF